MNYADIAGLSQKELLKQTKELKLKMFEARMKNAMGQLTNPMEIRVARRDVARMKMALASKTGAKSQSAQLQAKVK